ncbi:M23 family metallopeptidase [Ornithinimicrobium faecis]|uniref:M23 family metallopeptidase n=1 Tax=Ornithinimicrobium faecis TaxID=2934158 RepID=A0ABY4YPH3_9MICO|nr:MULTISPECIES: M23 family metallopeptidase [unclassified Ornithinimicrobium]USQ78599.1 M23 family metallopeptidase [Ornithinimicrobium sp. HY1793]
MRLLIAWLLGLSLVLPVAVATGQQPPAERDGDGPRITSFFAGASRAVAGLAREAARMQEVAAHGNVDPPSGPHEVAPRADWQWPLPGPREVVKFFDPPEKRWLPGHRGVDLAGYTYAPVLAVAAGTVTYSGSIAGIGIVSVTHPDGIRSTYQPVTERIDEGEQVSGGDRIGYLGAVGSHCLLRTCLHLGAVRGKDNYLDPLLFLQPWELTLLPHD